METQSALQTTQVPKPWNLGIENRFPPPLYEPLAGKNCEQSAIISESFRSVQCELSTRIRFQGQTSQCESDMRLPKFPAQAVRLGTGPTCESPHH